MWRSSLLLSRPLVFILCCFPPLASTKHPHVYTDSFPTNDEYDFSILDAHHVYGSPYGGFGRATRSRLAALPLLLPGLVGESMREANDVYTEVRDGDGRLFACRVYHEDELDSSSLTDSLFNTAKVKDPNEPEGLMTKGPDTATIDENGKIIIPGNELAESGKSEEEVSTGGATAKSLAHIIAIEKALSKLKGICTQIHMGWWSYEWCHDQRVAQFHIHVLEQGRDNKLRLDDVTSLGTHASRTIEMADTDEVAKEGEVINMGANDDYKESVLSDKPKKLEVTIAEKGQVLKIAKDDSKESSSPEKPKELGVIIDEFENGDICDETQLPRRTTVKLFCCPLETMRTFKNAVVYKGRSVKSNIAAIHMLKETRVCNYYLEVCTPLLCEGLVEAFENGLVAKELPPEEKIESNPVSRSPRERKKNESVREILEATLQNTCLRFFNGGWWVYEVCHGRHVRQYHEADTFDAATGSHSRVPESVHILGYYLKDGLEGFPNEEEILYVTNPTSDKDIGKNAAMNDSSGAYFEQEYTGGDVCDHSDITDAAIKAGNLGEGGIERATTVRYSCGKEFLITRVNEDSSCHYLVHITVPDLCDHPFFKAPVVKRQVVKCLPVDESSGVSIT